MKSFLDNRPSTSPAFNLLHTTTNKIYKKPKLTLLLLILIFTFLPFISLFNNSNIDETDSSIINKNNNCTSYNNKKHHKNEINLFDHERPENMFQLDLKVLKNRYKVNDTLEVIITPRHPKYTNKLNSTFFDVRVTGHFIFSPQLIKTNNSSRLVYNAPLPDPGVFKLEVRLVFYNYPGIYEFESLQVPEPKTLPNVELLDQLIVDGRWVFRVGIPGEKPLDSHAKHCTNYDKLEGRWPGDFRAFMPYSCKMPRFTTNDFSKILSQKNEASSSKYTWIRFLGDSNLRSFTSIIGSLVGLSCTNIRNDENTHLRQVLCIPPYELKTDKSNELVMSFEWVIPDDEKSLKQQMEMAFKDKCVISERCLNLMKVCDFDEPNNSLNRKICHTKKADHIFFSMGSHIPEWNEKRTDDYLMSMFNYLNNNYQGNVTFLTTNAVDVYKISKRLFGSQFIIRNNFRIERSNELLRKYVNKNVEKGYKNIDLIDFYAFSKSIWENSIDAVHFPGFLYREQAQIMLDRLIRGLN